MFAESVYPTGRESHGPDGAFRGQKTERRHNHHHPHPVTPHTATQEIAQRFHFRQGHRRGQLFHGQFHFILVFFRRPEPAGSVATALRRSPDSTV